MSCMSLIPADHKEQELRLPIFPVSWMTEEVHGAVQWQAQPFEL